MDPTDRVGCKAIDIDTALKKVQIELAKPDMPYMLRKWLSAVENATTKDLRKKQQPCEGEAGLNY